MSWMRGDNVVMGRWRRRQGRETSQCRRWLLRSLRGKLRKLYTVQGPVHWQLEYWNTLEAFFKIHKHWVHTISEHFY